MDYYPDGDLSKPGILFDVKEFFANNNGAYKRIPAQALLTSTALAANCLGSAIIRTSTGAAKMFAGSSTKIYQASGSGTWTDRSGAVTFAATTWDFQAFGDFTLAANGNAKVQVATTGNFADIAGAPTGAKILAVHANAVVAFNTTANNAAWHRSVTGDHTNWTAAANNDADSGTLYGGVGGAVTAAATFGNLLLAWKSKAMYGAVYVGNADPDQDVLRWQLISPRIGCVSQWAWIETEVGIVFVAENDIMLFNGGKPISIADKLRKTFVGTAMENRTRIFLTLDEPNNQVYIWVSPSGATYCSRAFSWNYKTGQWGRLHQLDDPSALLTGDARTPVRNANYEDLVAIGGFVTNTDRIANLFFDATLFKLVNLCKTDAFNGTCFLRTGYIGRPDVDSVLHRVHYVSDGYSAVTAPALAVTLYQANKSDSKIETFAAASKAWSDVNKTARYFELQPTFAADQGQVSISNLSIELQSPPVAQNPRQFPWS